MKILVTGGAGFVGTNLIQLLKNQIIIKYARLIIIQLVQKTTLMELIILTMM